MKRLIGIVAGMALTGGAYGAQCQGMDGKWHDYSSPECSGSSASSQTERSTTRNQDDKKIRIVAAHKAMVSASLKDPGSATFSSIRLLSSGTSCGYVNAKNSYGGYTGDQLFMVLTAGGKTHVLIGKDVYGTQVEANGVWVSADFYVSQCLRSKVVE